MEVGSAGVEVFQFQWVRLRPKDPPLSGRSRIVSIPVGAIEAYSAPWRSCPDTSFQFQWVRLRLLPHEQYWNKIEVSIPVGAIEASIPKGFAERYNEVSIPVGAIEAYQTLRQKTSWSRFNSSGCD